MTDQEKNLKNLFDLIRLKAQEKRRLETERQQTLKELLNRTESNPLDEINRQISGVN
ncbi:MAG: hypothetical protein WKF90_12095 [Pyrinomonadaceae bacterium]